MAAVVMTVVVLVVVCPAPSLRLGTQQKVLQDMCEPQGRGQLLRYSFGPSLDVGGSLVGSYASLKSPTRAL